MALHFRGRRRNNQPRRLPQPAFGRNGGRREQGQSTIAILPLSRLAASTLPSLRPGARSYARWRALRLQYRQCRPFWWLGDGQDVAPDIAALLLNCTNVEPAGDALFPDALGQSRRIRQ